MKAIIVDDEAVAAAALKRRIHWEKYGISDVQMAGSMRQAIQIMENEPMDLMLCDVEMPGGNGLELYEWVRTYRPETECIFVSCHPEYEYVRKALIMGSMDYVLKPVDYEEMDRILEEASRRIGERKSVGTVTDGSGYIKPAETVGLHSDAPAEEIPDHPLSDAIRDAVEYIDVHLDRNMSISEIAEVAHLNPQYFMRTFKKETGKPVLEYITERRLRKARELLAQTNLPITEVALAAGYDNFSYFSKLFKRNEGVTPSDFRKKQHS